VKVFLNSISIRNNNIRKFLEIFSTFPTVPIPRGRLLSWSKRGELRRYVNFESVYGTAETVEKLVRQEPVQ